MVMSKKKTPLVSVLMPVYNAEQYLKPALDSILCQTFSDFELIAINDGSTDSSGDILDEYQKADPRIVVVHRENKGLVATLNEAIDLSRGTYLARQDSDDLSFSKRFEKQVEILDAQPRTVLVTGSFEVFDEDDEYLYREILPEKNEDIARAMYLRNPIGHSSVMFRKDTCLLVGKYSDTVGPTEDYELWCRLASEGDFHALESAVFRWRVNTKGITSTKNAEQVAIMRRHLKQRWQQRLPGVISTKQLRARGNYYLSNFKKRGVSMKTIMLTDNAQLGVKMVRYGHPFKGSCQLLAVACTGRTGLKIAIARMGIIIKGSIGHLHRKLVKQADS